MLGFILLLAAAGRHTHKVHKRHDLFDLSRFHSKDDQQGPKLIGGSSTPQATDPFLDGGSMPGDTQTAADGSSEDGTVKGASVQLDVLKDGYWYVDCKADEMEAKGDKFGDNAQRYESGAVVGTSIVRYDVILDRENQEDMTPWVCFNFCRTVPDMNYFGLKNGRDCYCMHYYVPMTGDGVCDLPCEGDSSKTCGGKGMSSLYQMHECEGQFGQKASQFMSDVSDFVDELDDAAYMSDEAHWWLYDPGYYMVESVDAVEGSSSALSQAVMTASGPIAEDAERLYDMEDGLEDMIDAFYDEQIDPTDPDLSAEDRRTTEETMKKMEEYMAKARDFMAETKARVDTTFVPEIWEQADTEYWDSPEAEQPSRDSFATYEAIVESDAVCMGDITGRPKARLWTAEQCAQACDLEAPKSSPDRCIGFQHFDGSSYGDWPMCVLFKKITELTTYECDSYEAYEPWQNLGNGGDDRRLFLQAERVRKEAKKDPSFGPRCYVRHTDFLPQVREVIEGATAITRCYGEATTLVARKAEHAKAQRTREQLQLKHERPVHRAAKKSRNGRHHKKRHH